MEQMTSFSAFDRSLFDFAPNGAKTGKDVDIRCYSQLFGSNFDYCCWPQCEGPFPNATGEEGCKSACIMVYYIIGFAFALVFNRLNSLCYLEFISTCGHLVLRLGLILLD